MTRKFFILIAAGLLAVSLFAASTTKVGGSGTTKVGGSGKTKVEAAPAFGPVLVAHIIEGLSATGGTTSSRNTTGANLIVVAVRFFGTAVPANLSDSQGNTWSALGSRNEGGTALEILYCASPSTSATHTFTTTDGFSTLSMQAFSGLNASPYDTDNGNTSASSTTVTTGSVTPVQANVLAVTAVNTNGASNTPVSINGSYTMVGEVTQSGGNYYGGAHGYKIIPDGSAQNPTWTASGSPSAMVAAIALFKFP